MDAIVKSSGVGLLRSVDDVERVARLYVASGYFTDTRDVAQACIKIFAGAEIGLGSYASMTGIHIIQGKPQAGAQMMAGLIKRSGKYDYVVDELSDERCVITFTQHGSKIGVSEFTREDARKAGTKNLDKFARNMLFSRAMMNGARWFCPDILIGNIAEQDEFVDVYQAEEVPVRQLAEPVVKPVDGNPAHDPFESTRPYSADEFSARFKGLVERINTKGTPATEEQRAKVNDLLVSVFDDEADERLVLSFLTDVEEVSELGFADVIAFEKILKDFDLAKAELLAVRDSFVDINL